jgi:hypothetical protein
VKGAKFRGQVANRPTLGKNMSGECEEPALVIKCKAGVIQVRIVELATAIWQLTLAYTVDTGPCWRFLQVGASSD